MTLRTLVGSLERGLIIGGKLARGCELCYPGKKTVIFITGLCGDSCYYCPIDRNKLYHDVMKANERIVGSINEIIEEIVRSGSRGASITGGDPLTVPERTISLIRLLKDLFGDDFHIHLYTSGRYASKNVLLELDSAGLDEIRFHPTFPGLEKKALIAKKHTDMSVGFEVPVIPGSKKWIMNLIEFGDKNGLDFINLNELEVSEANLDNLLMRGLRVSKNGVVVDGSSRLAQEILAEALKKGYKIPIHYCPASFKDAIQTRFRLKNTIKNDLQVYEKAIDGLVEWYVIYTEKSNTCKKIFEKNLQEGIVFPSDSEATFFVHPDDLEFVLNNYSECVIASKKVIAQPTNPRLILEEKIIWDSR